MLIKEMYILEDVEVSPFNVMDGRLFENVIYYDKITDLLSSDLSHVAIRAVNLYKFIYVQQLNQNIDIITYTRNRSKTISQASFKYLPSPLHLSACLFGLQTAESIEKKIMMLC